jgi:hypothetical protein
MSESNATPHLSLVPSILVDMRAQLAQARAAGATPVEWLVRLEMMPALCDRARDEGALSGEVAHIEGILVRGSFSLLEKGALPVLVCEGDDYHRATQAMYAGG